MHTLKTLKTQLHHLKDITKGSPGGSVVKNVPADAEDAGSTPDPGGSHRLQGNWAHALQLWEPALWSPEPSTPDPGGSHTLQGDWACALQLREPALWSLGAATGAGTPGAGALHQEKPEQCEACHHSYGAAPALPN